MNLPLTRRSSHAESRMVMEPTSRNDSATASRDVSHDEIVSFISRPDADGLLTCLSPGCEKNFRRRENIESHVRASLKARIGSFDPGSHGNQRARDCDQHNAPTRISTTGSAYPQKWLYLGGESGAAARPTLLLHEGTWYASIPGLDAFESTKPSSVHQSPENEKIQAALDPSRKEIATDQFRRIFGRIQLGFANFKNLNPFSRRAIIFASGLLLMFVALRLIGPTRISPSSSPLPFSNTLSSPVPTHIGQIPDEPFAIQPGPPTLSKVEHHAPSCQSQSCESLWCSWIDKSQPSIFRRDDSYACLDDDGISIADDLRKEYRACFEACVPERSMVDNMECEDVYDFMNQGALGMCQYDHGGEEQLPKVLRKEPLRTVWVEHCEKEVNKRIHQMVAQSKERRQQEVLERKALNKKKHTLRESFAKHSEDVQ